MTHQHEILPLEGIGTTGGGPDPLRNDTGTNESATTRAVPRVSGTPADRVAEQWQTIQGKFVDDPRGSVSEARALVDDLMQRLVQSFSEQREALDRQWSTEPTVSTEQLRLCLQQYRALFTQLFPVVPPEQQSDMRPQR
jgi:polyhydroxyalkanoate synthesis regulator phasin